MTKAITIIQGVLVVVGPTLALIIFAGACAGRQPCLDSVTTYVEAGRQYGRSTGDFYSDKHKSTSVYGGVSLTFDATGVVCEVRE